MTGGKTKVRTDKEYKDLMNRLKRIEGQVRGIQSMLEKNAYCTDILTQVAAVNAALNSFNKVLLADHIRTCVADNIREGNDEVVDELVTTLQKLMKLSLENANRDRKRVKNTVPIGKINRDSTVPLERREIYGTIQRDRHELRCLQCPGGKSCF